MNLLKSPLRRMIAVAAGSILGMAGAFALAGPASAHAPSVIGKTDCISDGKWTVDWSIGNDYQDNAIVQDVAKDLKIEVQKDGKWTEVKDALTGPITTVTGPMDEAGKFIPAFSNNKPDAQIHGTTVISDEAVDKVKISVILTWPKDNYRNDGVGYNRAPETAKVSKPEKCAETPPTAPTTPTTTGPATTPATTSPTPTPTETIPTIPVPTPSTTDEPTPFKPILEEDCTTITIGAANPANGITWTLGFETSKGEKRSFTLKPGETKSEKFSAVTGFWVKVTVSVTVDGETYSDFTKIDYTQPDNCSEGGGGGLPVTGAAAGGIAGGAAVLLAVGAMLFVMARRRKVKFTA